MKYNQLIVVLTGLIFIAGCHKDEHDHPPGITAEELYQLHCSGCHQESGEGRFVSGIPSIKLTGLSSHEIADKIRRPHKQTGDDRNMPIYTNMPRQEALKIAVYIKSRLAKK